MKKQSQMLELCFPYSSGITCVCNPEKRIVRCFPELAEEVINPPFINYLDLLIILTFYIFWGINAQTKNKT